MTVEKNILRCDTCSVFRSQGEIKPTEYSGHWYKFHSAYWMDEEIKSYHVCGECVDKIILICKIANIEVWVNRPKVIRFGMSTPYGIEYSFGSILIGPKR